MTTDTAHHGGNYDGNDNNHEPEADPPALAGTARGDHSLVRLLTTCLHLVLRVLRMVLDNVQLLILLRQGVAGQALAASV